MMAGRGGQGAMAPAIPAPTGADIPTGPSWIPTLARKNCFAYFGPVHVRLLQTLKMLKHLFFIVAAFALAFGAEAGESRLALSGDALAPAGRAGAQHPLARPVVATRALAKAVAEAANEVLIDFQKCNDRRPDVIAFVGVPEHEPHISDAIRRRLNAQIVEAAGGSWGRPTEMTTLKLLAPFLTLDSKGQEEMKKAEEKIFGSPLVVIAEVRRPSVDVVELKLNFLDKRAGCAKNIWRAFNIDPVTLAVFEDAIPEDTDGELYELRGLYYRALAEFARPLAAATLTRLELQFAFTGNCDLRRDALPIFETSYQRLRQQAGDILQSSKPLPPLSDGDTPEAREAPANDDAARIRLRFSPSSLSRRHLSATLEIVHKGAKQDVLHANVIVDERALSGCDPAAGNGVPVPPVASPLPGKDCPLCPEMTAVPAGEVTIGSPDTEPGRSADEGPMAIRQIRALAIARHEVTLGEFEAFIAETGHRPGAMGGAALSACSAPDSADKWTRSPTRNHRQPGFAQTNDDPVVCVTWYDAKAYAQWLTGKTGKPYRLLSEAEFEYVARAGTRSPFWWGDSVDPKAANYKVAIGRTSVGPAGTVPKAALPANPWGFHNISGNAAEWVEDCWNERHAALAGPGDARLSGDCARRAIRGGGWTYEPKAIRSASRDQARAEEAFVDVGFRVAREGPRD